MTFSKGNFRKTQEQSGMTLPECMTLPENLPTTIFFRKTHVPLYMILASKIFFGALRTDPDPEIRILGSVFPDFWMQINP